MVKLVFDFAYSQVGDEPGDQVGRRMSARVSRMLRPAKLTVDGRDVLCVMRDISNGGLQLQLFHDLPEHGDLVIELDDGSQHKIRKVWATGDRMGCALLHPVDVGPILSGTGRSRPRRQPRLEVEHDAFLWSNDVKVPIVLRDISQRGAAIDCPAWLMIDELVRIESRVLPALYAKVRWRSPPRHGLVFEQTFRIDQLARVCLAL